jgi:hypothetical protein
MRQDWSGTCAKALGKRNSCKEQVEQIYHAAEDVE